MKAATKAIAPELNMEELELISGGNGNEDNYEWKDLLKKLLGPFISIAKKLIGPFLPPTFEEFYNRIKSAESFIENEIGSYDWKIRAAFYAYKKLPDGMKRDIWKAVYDALKTQMPMAR